jgi:hypothetical protein
MLPDFSNQNSTLVKIFQFNKSIKIYYGDNKPTVLFLKGIIYFGASHFTARILDRNSDVWYYDSTSNNGKSVKEKKFAQFTTLQLTQCHMRNASCIIYAKNY